MPHDVDINYGVDFECALEGLSHVASQPFRQSREAKQSHASEQAIARLRQAYLDTQREQEVLSPHDMAATQAVLARPA